MGNGRQPACVCRSTPARPTTSRGWCSWSVLEAENGKLWRKEGNGSRHSPYTYRLTDGGGLVGGEDGLGFPDYPRLPY